jgi:hypothetical protein
MSIKGTGPQAAEWSSTLEELTKRPDLHFLTLQWWIGDLPAHKLLRENPPGAPPVTQRGAIGIHFDNQGTRKRGLVADECLQLGKGPLRIDPVHFACLWRDGKRPFAAFLSSTHITLCIPQNIIKLF